VKLEKFEYCAKVIILMIMAYSSSKYRNSKCQKIRILQEINKKRILNTEMSTSEKYNHAYVYSYT